MQPGDLKSLGLLGLLGRLDRTSRKGPERGKQIRVWSIDCTTECVEYFEYLKVRGFHWVFLGLSLGFHWGPGWRWHGDGMGMGGKWHSAGLRVIRRYSLVLLTNDLRGWHRWASIV